MCRDNFEARGIANDLAFWGSANQLGQHTLNIARTSDARRARSLVMSFAESLEKIEEHLGDLNDLLTAEASVLHKLLLADEWFN